MKQTTMWRTFLENFNFSIVNGNGGLVSILLGLVVLGIIGTLLRYKKNKKLPPGPSGLPILGYYPFLLKNPRKALNDLAEKYGSVVGFCIGQQYTVILNDYDAVKEALGKNVTFNKPSSTFGTIPFNFGISVEDGGESWHQTRRVLLKALKDISLHSTHWEELVQEEVLDLVNRINQQGQRPFELRSFFSESFANNIMSLVLGERLPSGHRFMKLLVEATDLVMESQYALSMQNFSYNLHRLMQLLGVEMKFPLFEKVIEMCYAVSDIVDEKLKDMDKGSEDSSFIVQFQKEIENHHKSKENVRRITEENMKGTIIALLAGGSETGRTTTIWALISMAEHPEIQQKVHEELDMVLGKDGTIQWADRMKIPYTFATLLETMRWKTAAPIPSLRLVAEDTYIQGYRIPKGTYLTTNNWRIHSDPKYWPNPEKFIPERFLEDDGKKVNSSPESFNPFSYGKRICPGKLVALIENLQYFAILMQKFEVYPVQGNKVEHDIMLGLTEEAANVYLRFVPR